MSNMYDGFARIRVLSDRRIITATIDSPPINLITRQLLTELDALTSTVAADEDALVLVLKSADPDFFIPHAEFANLYSLQPDSPSQPGDETPPNGIHEICERLRTMDKVTIAQVEGRAGGGGAAIVMACDMRFGALDKAIFNNMAVPLGAVPGGGASQYMPRLVGRARSLELILGGSDLDAVTAERWGYLNRALPPHEIEAFVSSLARRIAACPPGAVRLSKALIDEATGGVRDGLGKENFNFQRLLASDASVERIRMFLAGGGETRDGERRLNELLDDVVHAFGSAAQGAAQE